MRILYLAHRVPDAPTKGDKIRAFHQVRELARHHEVHVFALDDEPRSAPLQPAWADEVASITVVPLSLWGARGRVLIALANGGSLSAAHFADPRLKRELDAAREQIDFDAAVVFSGAMDPLLDGMRPRVLDLVDVDSAKFEAYHLQRTVRGLKRWVFGLEGRRLRELERRASQEADATLLCTAAEAALMREFTEPRRLEVVGNGVDLQTFPFVGVEGRGGDEMLFVGAMDYQANIDAVKVLVHEVLPRVREVHPTARVTLVGSNPTSEVRRLGEMDSVELVADVPSVVPYLHRAALTVLPFRVARGVQNKALEALSAGLPLVLSVPTAQGLDGDAGEDYLVGGDDDELAAHCARLLRDPCLRERIAHQGRRLVEERYSWSAVLRRFLAIVQDVACVQPARGSESQK